MNECTMCKELIHFVDVSCIICSGGSTYKSFRRPPPPNRTKFFRFYICFHQKVPVLEVGAPSNEGWCPPTGNPGSAPDMCVRPGSYMPLHLFIMLQISHGTAVQSQKEITSRQRIGKYASLHHVLSSCLCTMTST